MFSDNYLLVVVISPLLTIVEDQVNYLGCRKLSLLLKGKARPKIKKYCMESWGGKGGCFVVWKPGVVDWRRKIQGNVFIRVLLKAQFHPFGFAAVYYCLQALLLFSLAI